MASVLDRLFVSSRDQNMVTVWDEQDQQVLTTFTVGSQPWGVGTVNNLVFVANYGSNSISVIDAIGLTKQPDIDVGSCSGKPSNVSVDPIQNRVYVAMNGGPGNVAVIDAATSTLVQCVPTGIPNTFGVSIDFVANLLYVTNLAGNNLLVYRTDDLAAGILTNVPLDGRPYSVQVDNFTGNVYVMVARNWPAYNTPNTVELYPYSDIGGVSPTVLATIGNTADGGMIWVSQANDNLYIAATASNELWVVDAIGNARAIALPNPYAITENYNLSRMYVGSRNIGWISIEPNDLLP
jgi:YVTN family beta-propeller protein